MSPGKRKRFSGNCVATTGNRTMFRCSVPDVSLLIKYVKYLKIFVSSILEKLICKKESTYNIQIEYKKITFNNINAFN